MTDRDLDELLAEPDVQEALRHLGRQAPELCQRCMRRQLAAGREVCAACSEELKEADKAKKRRSYHKAANTTAPPSKRAACSKWLKAQFHGRPVPGEKIHTSARRAGFSPRTLRRAATDVGITYDRHGDGTTSWILPPKSERDD